MISKDRTERDGLASFEALPGHMIGGTEENHAILRSIKAVSGPKYETLPPKYILPLLYGGGDGQQDCGCDVTFCSQLIVVGFKRHLAQDLDFFNACINVGYMMK